jgi:hypothetical protein
MLDTNEYWKKVKDFYETKYNSKYDPAHEALKIIDEMREGDAELLGWNDKYNVERVLEWIIQTQNDADNEVQQYKGNGGLININLININDTKVLKRFPNLFTYIRWDREIANFFLLSEIKRFETEILSNNKNFNKIALELKWMEMIKKNSQIENIFFL